MAQLRNIERIQVTTAPNAVAPYAHAVRAGDFYFITGQMPIDPQTNEYVTGDAVTQTARVLENLKIVLASCNLTLSDVVSARVFLTDMRDFEAVNNVYQSYFAPTLPARTCVAVTGLAGGADVEIDLIAYCPGTN
jgi:2-iminobutanoate/2-iminopropanoate deaminase